MNILYDDKHITVCIKPAGVLSEEKPDNNNTMTARLKAQLGTDINFGVVHRLDFDVSGIMVYGKTGPALSKLSAEVQNRTMIKEYLAITENIPETESGIYKDLLFKDSSKNKSFVVKRPRKGVKEASLEYTVLEKARLDGRDIALVGVKLHTGRTHQIRVQFSSRKTPLLGDGKYGSTVKIPHIALFSHRLTFDHPIDGKRMTFEAFPENEMPWSIFCRLTK